MGTGVPSAFSILLQIFTQRQGKAGEENEAKDPTEQHKQMERYIMFLIGRINVVKMTILPQEIYRFQCNLYQNTNGIFHRTRTNNYKICMETQKAPKSQNNLEKEE